MKRIVVPGARFGEWTIVEVEGRKVIAECSCGQRFNRYSSNFVSGKSTRCQKCGGDAVAKQRTNGHGEDWQRKTVIRLIKRDRGKGFELDDDEVWCLSQQPCRYCLEPPSNEFKYASGVLKYNGLDRVDSNLGYIPGNVVTSCWNCNSAKKQMSEIDFVLWINKIYHNFAKGYYDYAKN